MQVHKDAIVTRSIHLADVHNKRCYPLKQNQSERTIGNNDMQVEHTILKPALYLGTVGSHFGHNLMNECSRLLALLDADTMKDIEVLVLVVIPGQKSIFETLAPKEWSNHHTQHSGIKWMRTLLSAFPLSSSKTIILTSGAIEFASLSVPPRLLQAGMPVRQLTPACGTLFRHIRDSLCSLSAERERIYISRTQFDNHCRERLSKNPNAKHTNIRICTNEEALETELRKRQFKICTFENLTFKEQITTAAQSSVLMSLGGSGLHNSCFCQSDGHVVSLGDYRWHESERERNGNQLLMNAMVPGLKFSFIKMQLTAHEDVYYTLDIPYTIGQIDKVLKE